MPKPKSTLLTKTALVLLPPVTIIYGMHRGLTHLEIKYKPINPETSTSIAFRTPPNPSTQHCPHVDVHAARIPLRVLKEKAKIMIRAKKAWEDGRSEKEEEEEKKEDNEITITNRDLEEAWARAFLKSRIIRLEERLFALSWRRNFQDMETEYEGPLHSLYELERVPLPLPSTSVDSSIESRSEPSFGYLFSWKMDDSVRIFFESISRYGYPWRMMSGGRHELSISRPSSSTSAISGEGDENEGEEMIEVRFSSAHDYEIVPEEGGLGSQKVIPDWTERLHRGFGRLVLDRAVKEMCIDD